ncbi:MAG: hypothetical protein ACE14O_03695 [Candidatus Cloacimonadaceae bacterium]
MKSVGLTISCIFILFMIFACKKSHEQNSILPSSKSDNSNYMGKSYKGNYIWSGAINLAWIDLTNNVAHRKISFATDDSKALLTLNKFNNPVITYKNMDKDSYFIKSGYGQSIIDSINLGRKRIFPSAHFPDLADKLKDNDIIAYSYFMKSIEYLYQFHSSVIDFVEPTIKKKTKRQMESTREAINRKEYYNSTDYIPWVKPLDVDREYHAYNPVSAIEVMGSPKSIQNIDIVDYRDENCFIVRIRLKDPRNQLFLAKGFPLDDPSQVLMYLSKKAPPNQNTNHWFGRRMKAEDTFLAPIIRMNIELDFEELRGQSLSSKTENKDYNIFKIGGGIQFNMNDCGINVLNKQFENYQDWKYTKKGLVMEFNKPYWIIMRKYNSDKPYFILGVNTSYIMNIVHLES